MERRTTECRLIGMTGRCRVHRALGLLGSIHSRSWIRFHWDPLLTPIRLKSIHKSYSPSKLSHMINWSNFFVFFRKHMRSLFSNFKAERIDPVSNMQVVKRNGNACSVLSSTDRWCATYGLFDSSAVIRSSDDHLRQTKSELWVSILRKWPENDPNGAWRRMALEVLSERCVSRYSVGFGTFLASSPIPKTISPQSSMSSEVITKSLSIGWQQSNELWQTLELKPIRVGFWRNGPMQIGQHEIGNDAHLCGIKIEGKNNEIVLLRWFRFRCHSRSVQYRREFIERDRGD